MKQVIVIRNELKMPKGKLASQVAHASVECVLNSDEEKVSEWRDEGMMKIVLKVESLNELQDIREKAKREKLVTAMIKDAGKTVFEKPEITCLGIGPDDISKIDKVVGKLKLL